MFGIPRGTSVLFSHSTRVRLGLAMLGSIVAAALEILGVASVVPLMQLLTGSDVESGALGALSSFFGDPPPSQLARYIAAIVFSAFVAKALFTIAFRWWLTGFLAAQEAETAISLLRRYLAAPYWLHLHRSSTSFVRTMNEAVSQTYSVVVIGVVSLISETFTVVALTLVLLVVDPVPAIAAIVYFAVVGFAFDRLVRSRASSAGQAFQDASLAMSTTVFETLHGIKEVKVRRTSAYFLDKYAAQRLLYARSRRVMSFLTELPRYVLELVFVGGAALLTIVSLARGDAASTLTTLALFLAAGFRMLPSLVRIAASAQQVRTGVPGVRLLLEDMRSEDLTGEETDDPSETRRLPLRQRLVVDGVSYTYPGGQAPVLRDVRLAIPAGSSVALVGGSGAGKTTLVDLVLGLHSPTDGRVVVDGRPIDEDLGAWQRSIGFVPQDVYLIDDSLRANIAFGEPEGLIDDERVRSAIRRAQLEDHVRSLPQGLSTRVGERGTRLSGGQRQRLGIARALYREPEVLVLDEATSALDNQTERRITDVIRGVHGEVTVIVVAHRLSTVMGCDQIVFLDTGRVAATGSFEEVRRLSPAFDHLVELGTLDGSWEPADTGAPGRSPSPEPRPRSG